MTLKGIGLYFFLALTTVLAAGQVKKTYYLPPSVSPAEIEQGAVWVKLKNTHRDVFKSGSGARIASGSEARPLLNNPTKPSSSARLGPFQPRVDISLYYKLTFDKSRSVEEFINELYASGYYETVEPIYRSFPMLTPNDPSLGQQYYLNMIKAPAAWDITNQDDPLIIGIVDTGGDLDHPDLQSNLYIDPAEPVDGLDNNNDGFIDNNKGWDFSGSSLALIGTPGFKGDNDPSINKGNLFSHGTMVAGCAAASTNNGIGISSIGFNTKLLFTKHFADDQADVGAGYSSNLYDGILYAATHGARIINCSWGGYNRGTIAQDIITYVTIDLNCLIVAAAGNSNIETPIYPASYEHVLSVASSDASDVRSTFSNFGKTIDIIAPGTNIFTTTYNNAYGSDSGTSLSAPIVSGAAALLWAHNPTLSALQVGEQLRVSADESIYANNPAYLHKLGKGRLDVLRALTLESPSIRASNKLLMAENGTDPDPGDKARLYFDFTNYLKPTSSALKVELTSASPHIMISKGEITLGSLAQNFTIRNTTSPFEITLSPSLPIDTPIEALLSFTDGEYEDFQIIHLVISSYIDVNENNIITSITPAGRIGYGNTGVSSSGSGFLYNEESLLYEMGLIMGTSASNIFNNVRTTAGAADQDFVPFSKIAKHTPGERSYSEVTGDFINSSSPGTASISVSYRSMVWKDNPYRDFVILEYKIKNMTAAVINNFHFGLFADWDISAAGASDKASWDNATKLGYVYTTQPAGMPLAGMQVLGAPSHYYAIDNDESIAGNPFGIYDGFTDAEKFKSVSSGLLKVQAGNATGGGDVSHAAASGPYIINPGGEITVAFALHAALTKDALINSAKYADSVYNYTFKEPMPVISVAQVCYGSKAILQATGATKFKWYKDLIGGSPFFTGSQYTTKNLTDDTVFYVSNADHHYESLRTPARVEVKANPHIKTSGSLEFCEGATVVLSVNEADEYSWSTGEKTQSIEVGESGLYSVSVKNNSLECSSSDVITVKVSPNPSAAIIFIPEEAYLINEMIQFTNGSSGSVSWLWDFGDGQTSTDENPIHIYDELGDFTLTLTAISAEGCEDRATMSLGVVTGIEDLNNDEIKVYPNPVRTGYLLLNLVSLDEDAVVNLFNPVGIRILTVVPLKDGETLVDVSSLPNGVYILKINASNKSVVAKIIVAN